MTLASSKVKKAALGALGAALTPLGYTLRSSEPKTFRTQFRRSLNDDVVVGLRLEFFDGAVASATSVHMSASFGIASKKLVALDYQLHNEAPNDDFLPIHGSCRPWAPSSQAGAWFFELPVGMADAQHFGKMVAGPLEDLLRHCDSADKQIAMLRPQPRAGLNWNDFFFEPIALLYEGQGQAAVAAAQRVFDAAAHPGFRAAYEGFMAGVYRAASAEPR